MAGRKPIPQMKRYFTKAVKGALHSDHLLACPEYRSTNRLLEHGIAVMLNISRCGDQALEFAAAKFLLEYAKSLPEQASKPRTRTRDEIIEELRETYARSLPPAHEDHPLILEAEAEAEPVKTQ